MSRSFTHLCAITLIFTATSVVRAESLFLPQAVQEFNVNVVTLDAKYTIANKAAGIGKFTALGTPIWYGSPSNAITLGTFRVEAFFNLATGAVRLTDPGNLIHVDGTVGGVAKTFFHSATLKRFGSGTQDSFDLVFGNNSGIVQPGSDIQTRIMGVSIPNFSDPTFQFSTVGKADGDVLFDNTKTTTGGIEKGVANVWAPTPTAASGGLILFAGFGAFRGFRRSRRYA